MGKTKRSGGETPEKQASHLRLNDYPNPWGVVDKYAKPANEGLFCVKDYCNHGHIGSYTLITPQGKLYFAQLRDMILMVV